MRSAGARWEADRGVGSSLVHRFRLRAARARPTCGHAVPRRRRRARRSRRARAAARGPDRRSRHAARLRVTRAAIRRLADEVEHGVDARVARVGPHDPLHAAARSWWSARARPRPGGRWPCRASGPGSDAGGVPWGPKMPETDAECARYRRAATRGVVGPHPTVGCHRRELAEAAGARRQPEPADADVVAVLVAGSGSGPCSGSRPPQATAGDPGRGRAGRRRSARGARRPRVVAALEPPRRGALADPEEQGDLGHDQDPVLGQRAEHREVSLCQGEVGGSARHDQ